MIVFEWGSQTRRRPRRRRLPACPAGTGYPVAAARPAGPAGPARCRRSVYGRLHRERGDIALELVLIAPIIIFMIFLVIQFSLWYHARHVVTVAAQEGARAARAANTSSAAAETAGRNRAYAFIDTLGGSIVEDPNVVVNRGVNTVSVRVTANAVHVIPGLSLQVRGQSVGPIERFVPPS